MGIRLFLAASLSAYGIGTCFASHEPNAAINEVIKTMKAQPTIELALAFSDHKTGDRFGISVPLLCLSIRNNSDAHIEIPESGLPMLQSLEVTLLRDGSRIVRRVGTGKYVQIDMVMLSAGESLSVELSPLDDGPGESPLEPGDYSVSVCVVPQAELTEPSSFAEYYGGQCANMLALSVVPIS